MAGKKKKKKNDVHWIPYDRKLKKYVKQSQQKYWGAGGEAKNP